VTEIKIELWKSIRKFANAGILIDKCDSKSESSFLVFELYNILKNIFSW